MTNIFKKFRIESLFFRSFFVLIFLVLVSIVWTSYNISSKALVKNTSHYQQQLLEELNNEISTRLTMIEQISLSTSRDNELIRLLWNSQDEFDRHQKADNVQNTMANLTYSIPIIQGIDLYMERPFRKEENSYIQFWDIEDLDNRREWSQYLDKNDFAWTSEYEIPSFTGNVPVLSFGRKILFNDTFLGVVVIHVKAQEIRTLLKGRSRDSNRIMTDSNGQEILKIGEMQEQLEMSQRVNMETEKSGFIHIRGNSTVGDSLLVYSKLNDSNWTLVEMTPWNQITASSIRLAEVIGIIGVAAVLLMLMLTLYLSRQFTKPINMLVSAMSSYSIGGKNQDLPGDYQNEFGYLFAGYRKQNERIEDLYVSLQQRYEQQRKAEIEALQANINPHFLYNMLDQLNWMAIEAGHEELSRILELMGQMFRIGLSNGDSFIPIANELEHIKCYLEIQQLRWGNGLNYAIDVPMDVMELYIPKLTLQPFVENSIVHGFNTRLAGYVHIQMNRLENSLQIIIDDDGIGLQQVVENKRKRHTGGYGIRNVRDRIAGYFRHIYGVELYEREEGGTRVEIFLPLLTEPPTN
ncbi:sensor histidine kinase [Paenibacillus qinlingensis]|uniref:sensor histidine kinase n=1 Tax=Paenibacillus qinlingensis TaxID=1837343 RepID=UPI001564A028|nr:histidine kinase [Paenibacillus qinlingensis]NQX63600.1 sensor histidine kinase [Paenibacillus qinlingensis]